jgi:hypothetical protein
VGTAIQYRCAVRRLELISLPLGKSLYESGEILRHVYFPTGSIISVL